MSLYEEDYNFLADFIRSNRNVINSCTDLFLSNYTQRTDIVVPPKSLFSIDGEMFWPSFTMCAVIIAILVTCGLMYECHRQFGWIINYWKTRNAYETNIDELVSFTRTKTITKV